jgi:hypothetical protein
MAYQKKCYRGSPVNSENVYRVNPMKKTNGAVHQSRGGGLTTRKSAKKNYATRPVETPISPTFIKATEAKKLKV